MTDTSDAPFEKYFKSRESIIVNKKDGTVGATFTHLYIRKLDPYRHHIGDVDFILEKVEYNELKESVRDGTI